MVRIFALLLVSLFLALPTLAQDANIPPFDGDLTFEWSDTVHVTYQYWYVEPTAELLSAVRNSYDDDSRVFPYLFSDETGGYWDGGNHYLRPTEPIMLVMETDEHPALWDTMTLSVDRYTYRLYALFYSYNVPYFNQHRAEMMAMGYSPNMVWHPAPGSDVLETSLTWLSFRRLLGD